MADNVIDELRLNISADATKAISTLKDLKTSLEGINTAIGGLDRSSGILGAFSSRLARLNDTDVSNIKIIKKELTSLSTIDLKQFKNPISINIDPNKLNQANAEVEKLKSTMSELSLVNGKDSGANSFVNSIRRLSEVDLSNFNTNQFNNIASGIERIAHIEDISSNINRLVSSLARLANAGDKTAAASSALPSLGSAIQKIAVGLASSGGIPNEINAFVSALASLANAGNKTGTTASQMDELSVSLIRFFNSMQEAPTVSENALRMTEALGQLASAGSRTGAATKSVTDSMNKIGSARLDGLKGALNSLGTVLEKVAGKARSAASKIYNALKQISSARPSIVSTTNSIKTLIGAMIGFRGITGFANLLKETVELGANLTEIDHIVESVFGDMAGYVDQWAQNAITQFGIAEHSAKQYAGVLSSMFQASKIGYQDAGKMAMDLVGLAGDLSAFYNIDTETAYNKIRSGMAGMVRPLRKQYCAYVQKCA